MLRTAPLLVSLALAGWSPVASAAVAESAAAVRPIEVGEAAPTALCRDVDGKPAPLDAWIGREAIALVFYRGGW